MNISSEDSDNEVALCIMQSQEMAERLGMATNQVETIVARIKELEKKQEYLRDDLQLNQLILKKEKRRYFNLKRD